MLTSLNALALRFFKANKFMAISSILGIMLSVALVVTLTVFSHNAKASMKLEVQKMYGNMDLSVGYDMDQKRILDESIMDRITTDGQIKYVSPILINNFRVDKLRSSIYTLGVENDDLVKSRYHFNEDLSIDEVSINRSLAEALQVHAGSKLMIEHRPFNVKEVFDDMSAAGVMPDILIFNRDRVRQIEQEKGQAERAATYLLIKARPEADHYALADRIHAMDPQLRIDIAEENEFLKQNLANISQFIIVLSVLVLIVTSLLVISNFEVFLYKYRHQMAILRSMGASENQLFRIVLIQSMIITGIGGLLGLILAGSIHKLTQALLSQWFSVSVSGIQFHVGTSVAVTLLCVFLIEIFMLYPAYRISNVLPYQVMQSNETTDFSHGNGRARFGKFLIGMGFILLIFAEVFVPSDGENAILILSAALSFIMGMFVMLPVMLTPLLLKLLPAIRATAGKLSFVAVKNVIPQVRKNTFIILCISILITIAVFGSSLFKTIEKNDANYLKSEYKTDIIITSRTDQGSTIVPADIEAAIKANPSIEKASAVSYLLGGNFVHDDRFPSLTSMVGSVQSLMDQGLLPKLHDWNPLEDVVVSKGFAEKYELKTGARLEVGQYSTSKNQMHSFGMVRVAGIIDQPPEEFGDMYIDWNNSAYKGYAEVKKIFVSTNDEQAALKELKELNRIYPGLKMDSYENSMAASKQMMHQRLAIFVVVVVIMMISILLGTFNSIINHIHSKGQEFAILRAVAVSRKGIRHIILTQLFVFLSIGINFGLLSGVVLVFTMGLIDPEAEIQLNFRFVEFICFFIFAAGCAVFVPYASRIAGRNIPMGLTQDNK